LILLESGHIARLGQCGHAFLCDEEKAFEETLFSRYGCAKVCAMGCGVNFP